MYNAQAVNNQRKREAVPQSRICSRESQSTASYQSPQLYYQQQQQIQQQQQPQSFQQLQSQSFQQQVQYQQAPLQLQQQQQRQQPQYVTSNFYPQQQAYQPVQKLSAHPLFPQMPSSGKPVVTHTQDILSDFGNDLDPANDLGVDGAFSEYSVLFLGHHCGHTTLKPALEKKGFKVTFISKDTRLFVEKLKVSNSGDGPRYDVVGFTSDSTFDGELLEEFKSTVIEAYKLGCGLFIFADNQPFIFEANIVLPEIAGCIVSGDDHGGQTLIFGSDPNEPGRFDKSHLIFSGINSLYEGITICYPVPVCLEGNTTPEENKLETIATSTHDRPVISKIEATEDHGRLILDTGWTKLYDSYWSSTGQARYVVNACVWLTNIEARHGGVAPVGQQRK